MIHFKQCIQQLLLGCMFLSFSAIGQIDFNNYTSLESKGKLPEIFSESTEEKIKKDMEEVRESMSTSEEEVFLEHIHYNVDELLHSGLVLFGDPATKYVQDVANNLLNGAPKLKRKLQFYVLKSNVTNALSTEQGVIFVTMGLLSQLENEAQLAYVLSHEIAHFQENHVEESYTKEIRIDPRTSYDKRITNLSNHSKENELEADKIGIKLYHKAGYSKGELLSAFDVLMYSYLPFDEVALPKDYFNNELLYVPEKYFVAEINPISAEEDYDDEKSSHPNIRKRKDAITEEVKSYSDWGSEKFVLEQSRFEYVRTIARFESVRLDLLDANFGDALYSLFLLERDYPNNLYLARCKAQAWLGLAAFKLDGSFSDVVRKPSKVEGESHAMHYFLRKLSKIQLLTIAVRKIEDARKTFPEDAGIKEIQRRMVAELAQYSRFKLLDYRRINYETALERFEQSKEALVTDTLAQEEGETDAESTEGLSKYDKIKKKRNSEEAVSEDEEFDVDKFHLYALSDLLGNDEFKDLYREEEEAKEREDKREEKLNQLSYRERARWERENNGLNEPEVIFIEPAFYSSYYDKRRPKSSVEVKELIIEGVKEYGDRFEIKVHDLTLGHSKEDNTEKFNERVLLADYLRKRISYDEDMEMFPPDYDKLMEIHKRYNGAKMLFLIGNHVKTKVTNRGSLTFILIDLKTGELKEVDTAYFRKPKRFILEGYIYDVLSQFKPKSKK